MKPSNVVISQNKSLLYVRSIVLTGCLTMAMPLHNAMASVKLSNLTINLILTSRACTLNDNKAIEVKFGEILATKINGVNYRMPIDYSLSCPAGMPVGMRMQLRGGVTSFDNSALQTSVTGLGIKMQNMTSEFPLNSWINFNYPDMPKLFAVPIRKANTVLTGGIFSASATLMVDYQ